MRAGLEGHEFDLLTLAELFPDGDPRVVKDDKDGRYYLESAKLDPHFTDVGRMEEVAEEILGQLIGIARLQPSEFHDVSLTGQFDRPKVDGGRDASGHVRESWVWRERAMVASVEPMAARGRLTAAAEATHPDGAIVEPAEPRGHRYLRLVRAHPEVAELIRLLGTSDMSWEDLYKAYEVVRDASKQGRKPRWSLDQLGYAKTDVDNFTETANVHRHAQSSRRPKRELTLAEAQEFVRDMAERWFRQLESSDG